MGTQLLRCERAIFEALQHLREAAVAHRPMYHAGRKVPGRQGNDDRPGGQPAGARQGYAQTQIFLGEVRHLQGIAVLLLRRNVFRKTAISVDAGKREDIS